MVIEPRTWTLKVSIDFDGMFVCTRGADCYAVTVAERGGAEQESALDVQRPFRVLSPTATDDDLSIEMSV